MNGLLDTNNFIWSDGKQSLLSPQVRAFMEDRRNRLFLSIASVWEMQIKAQVGKLSFQNSLPEVIREQQEQNGIEILPVTLAHVYALSELPSHHRDPFDRIIIAQARVENLIVLSADETFSQYSVQLLR